jgi:hypothetical protein
MNIPQCSECGTNENLKPAREYPCLVEIIRDWHASGRALDSLLCPNCADAVCGNLGRETIQGNPLDFSGNADQVPGSHSHSWIIFSTMVDQGWLLVRCKCGGVGIVKDPTSEEWSRAFNAPCFPCMWPEPGRVEVLEGWTTALDLEHEVWTVVRG